MREHSDRTPSNLDVEAVVEVLEEAPVTRGILFGSHARGDDRSTSDVDIAVEFDEDLSSVERTKARLAIIERVSVVLGLDAVDVIPLSTASAELRREIAAEGVVLVGRPLEVADEEAPPEQRNTRERFDELLDDMERVV